MKDLKHLKYFEDLLQEANNDLIRRAQEEGKICAAYVCENTPEPLLNLPGMFSTRLRAPRTSSLEVSTYYLTSFLCEYTRALLERAVEGGYNFADCIFTPDGCSMMNRCVENMELLKTMGAGKDNFFFSYMEIPMKADDNGLNLYKVQCENHILKPLREHYGIDTSVRKELIAATKSVEEIREYIGADTLHFLSIEGLKQSVSAVDPEAMCYACFNSAYPIEDGEKPAGDSKYVFEQRKC